MDSEKIFKTSFFGGFKKEDVLSYIEELKNEIEELKFELHHKEEKIDALDVNIEKLTAQCEHLKSVQQSYLEQSEILHATTIEKAELSQKVAELQKIADAYEQEKHVFAAKEENIKNAESQLGAAFLDARKYSDEIVTAANSKASEISNKVSGDITTQAQEITKLSAEVDRIADDFSKSIDALHANIVALASKMSLSANELSSRKSAPAFIPDVQIKIDGIHEKIESVTTDEESGLTFIQYPPHTNFNEDLNITSQSIYKFDKSKEG